MVLPTLQTGGGNLSAALLQSIFAAGANVDALFQGDGVMLPSTVILDYVYGVAAYKTWHSNREGVPIIMNEYRKENYAKIPPLPRSPPDDTEDNTPVPDDPTDTDYNPTKQKHYKATTDESELARAMDELNMFLMCVTHGITPEEAAERRQKKVEQEEQAAQEASQNKVMEWKEKLNIGWNVFMINAYQFCTLYLLYNFIVHRFVIVLILLGCVLPNICYGWAESTFRCTINASRH